MTSNSSSQASGIEQQLLYLLLSNQVDEVIYILRATGVAALSESFIQTARTALAQRSRLDAYLILLDLFFRERRLTAQTRKDYVHLLCDLGKVREAVAAYEAPGLIDLDADDEHNFGYLLELTGSPSRAEAAYQRALEIDPTHKAANLNLVTILLKQRDLRKLLDAERRCGELLSASSDLTTIERGILADALYSLGFQQMAVDQYKQMLSNQRSFAGALLDLLVLPQTSETQSEMDCAKKRFKNHLDHLSNTLDEKKLLDDEPEDILKSASQINNFYVPYVFDDDCLISAKYADLITPKLETILSRKPVEVRQSNKILVVVSTFEWHYKTFVRNLLSKIISERDWRIIYVNYSDSITPREQGVDILEIPLSKHSLVDFANQVRSLSAVAVYFPEIGMSKWSRTLSMLRFAPIQFTSWLHPATSGSPTIDYFLSGEDMELETADENYAEKLVRLSGCGQVFSEPNWVVQANQSEILAEPGSVACLQSIFKIRPEFDQTLAALCKIKSIEKIHIFNAEVPRYRSVVEARFRDLTAKPGQKAGKLHLENRKSGSEYWNYISRQICVFDVPNWAGGNTTIDCLSLNVPVITWGTSKNMRGRHGVAIMKLLEMPELIVSSTAQFLELIARIVSDKAYRDDLSAKIDANKHKIFNDHRPTLEFANWLDRVSKARL